MEEAATLFDQHEYASTAGCLKQTLDNLSDDTVKREISSFRQLAEALDAWDRFKHKEAIGKIKSTQRNINDLQALFGPEVAETLKIFFTKSKVMAHAFLHFFHFAFLGPRPSWSHS